MKKFILLSILFASIRVFAESSVMLCEVEEIFDGQRSQQTVSVNINPNDTHGSIEIVSFQFFPKYTGLIAFSRGFAVISISDTDTGLASSSQNKMLSTEDIAHHQLLLPSEGEGINGFTIDCRLQ